MELKLDKTLCVCGSGKAYSVCCAPYHQGQEKALTAEILMRSRYSAYVLNLYDYIRETWHSSTYPVNLTAPDVEITWLGLEIRRFWTDGEDEAFVEFVARSRLGGGRADRMHEVSRFIREEGCWFYVDGTFLKK